MNRSVLTASAAMLLTLSSACSEAQVEEVLNSDRASVETATEADSAPLASDREMTVNGLAGSFRDAGGDAPAILIVPGSGPTDRNGNSPSGIAASSYRMLADGLQAAGVSSLRVDKHGMFGSSAAGDGNAVTVDLYAQDYLDWADALRAETGRDCVHLLGHSEGGLMVSAAAARDSEGLCGLILVAAPGRPLGDVLREQLRANPANAPILPDALATIDALEAGERVDVSAMHPALQGLFAPAVQGFLISSLAAD
ncbi:MAG: alpha/beta hydrolase, partial [Litorimonas sp.]